MSRSGDLNELKKMKEHHQRWRITYWVYLVGFLDLFAVSLIVPLVGREARQRGASPTMAGIIGSFYGGLQLFSSPAIGYWSDLADRKFVLLICLLISAVGYLLLGLSTSVLLLLLARIPPGIFKHSMSISKTYLAEVTPKDEQVKVFGHYSAYSNIGFIVGPTVAGHLLELSGFNIVALLTALFFIIQFAIVWIFLPPLKLSSRNTKKTLFSLSSWIKDIKQVNWSNHWDLFILKFTMSLAVSVFRSNLLITLEDKYHTTPSWNGYIVSYQAFISTISSYFVGSIYNFYQDANKLLFHTTVMLTLSILGLTLATNVWWLVLLFTPLSLSTSVARVIITDFSFKRCNKKEYGIVMGLGQSVMSSSRMVSPVISGMSQELSVDGPGYIGTLIAAIGTLSLILRSKKDISKKKKS